MELAGTAFHRHFFLLESYDGLQEVPRANAGVGTVAELSVAPYTGDTLWYSLLHGETKEGRQKYM